MKPQVKPSGIGSSFTNNRLLTLKEGLNEWGVLIVIYARPRSKTYDWVQVTILDRKQVEWITKNVASGDLAYVEPRISNSSYHRDTRQFSLIAKARMRGSAFIWRPSETRVGEADPVAVFPTAVKIACPLGRFGTAIEAGDG